jgi:hypothetical protein
MGKEKHMDESAFAKIVKEFNAVGELIRARQDEKQAIMDEFDNESKRFYFGKISEKTLASSAKKTNNELQKLDDQIRTAIANAADLANQAKKFAAAQSPRSFKATLTGVVSSGSKSRRKGKRRPVKRSAKKTAKKRKTTRRKTPKKKSKKKSARKKK